MGPSTPALPVRVTESSLSEIAIDPCYEPKHLEGSGTEYPCTACESDTRTQSQDLAQNISRLMVLNTGGTIGEDEDLKPVSIATLPAVTPLGNWFFPGAGQGGAGGGNFSRGAQKKLVSIGGIHY